MIGNLYTNINHTFVKRVNCRRGECRLVGNGARVRVFAYDERIRTVFVCVRGVRSCERIRYV